MPQFIIVIASVLILQGLAGYFGTARVSVTALIPAFFGLPIALAGLLALLGLGEDLLHQVAGGHRRVERYLEPLPAVPLAHLVDEESLAI